MIAVDAQNDAAKQTNDVEDLIQKGVDVVVINPTDSDAVASAVSAANAANVPVITVDRVANSGKVVSHIASNNIEGGQMASDYIRELVGEGANVAELEGIPGSSAARERGKGFHNVADKSLKVVANKRLILIERKDYLLWKTFCKQIAILKPCLLITTRWH